jgi:hypothetical protein
MFRNFPHNDLLNDKKFEEFVTSGEYKSMEDFINTIKETGLVFIDNNKLKMLVDKCDCFFLPDGRKVAAENKSGRLSAWVNKEIEKYNDEK